MKRSIILCTVVAVALLGAFGYAQQRRAGEQALAEALHLDAKVKVSYLDSNGKPISFDEFNKQTDDGRSFSTRKDSDAGTTVLKLSADSHMPQAAASVLKLKIKPGESLPAFALDSTGGRHLSNADLVGHYTLLSFYFAECLPCIAEVPALNAYAAGHKDIHTLAVTFDDFATASSFAKKHGLQWDSVTNARPLLDALGVRIYPTMALIGPDGKLLAATISTSVRRKGELEADDLALWVDQQRGRPDTGTR